MKKVNFMWGIILILVGIILGLNAFGVIEFNIFFKGWWTFIIIVPNLIALFKEKKNLIGNLTGLFIGIGLLLLSRDLISFTTIMKLIVPVGLIIMGLSFLFKDYLISKLNVKSKLKDDEEYYAIFGSQNLDFNKDKFEGAQLNAIFGSIKIDLSNANIKKNTTINATSIFGGIAILLPKDINVKVVSTPIFGEVTNKHINSDSSDNTIYVNSICMFGGVDIK